MFKNNSPFNKNTQIHPSTDELLLVQVLSMINIATL